MVKKETDYAKFNEIADKIIHTEKYESMKNYIAHSDITTYEHSVLVAKSAYNYAVNHKVKCDIESLVRGALLHDYFLYDWHKNPKFTFHGFKHAKIAMKNAERDYGLNDKEKNIILSHMFPLNLFSFPKCREAWIVTMADKKSAITETMRKYKKGYKNNTERRG